MRLVAILLSLSCSPAAAQGLDVEPWRIILDTYATADGGFRYAALRENEEHRALLRGFVRQIGRVDPAGLSSRDGQLAFYLDAYNALVVQAVVDRWPMRSVMRVPGFFDRIRHRVGRRTMTLNELEHEVIRAPRFGEPRIHFALNCASAGCPPLARRPYSTQRDLAAELERRTRAFVRRTTRIDRRAGTVAMSQLFEWFAGDFGDVREFVAQRLSTGGDVVRDPATRIVYTRYDWALNDRP